MTPEFQSYLEKMIEYALERKQSFYISTDAIERPQLKLMAQKIVEKKQDGQLEERVNPVPVLEGIRALCAKHKHVVLVGRPGSGKSTALNQFLIDQAERSLENPAVPIPVLVQLKSDQPILELIRKALRRGKLRLDETAINDLLFDGKLLLLLDGINEIPRQALQQTLQEFREDNPDVSMIFTTRDLASGGYLGIEKQLEMQPLTPTQLRDFVGQSFPEQSAEFLNQLSDRLKELGKTPLLLEMLCDVFRMTGKVPENSGLVFREFTQHYERNLKEGVRIESDRELWKPVLQHLAWVMMQGEKPTEFRVSIGREAAIHAIGKFLNEEFPYAEARKCLRDLQNYHLIQAGTNSEELEFRHQLIQEYYAAEALLEKLPQLDDETLKREYLNFLKWTEAIGLMLALTEETTALYLVRLALTVDFLLSQRLIRVYALKDDEKLKNLVDTLPSHAAKHYIIVADSLDIRTSSLPEVSDSQGSESQNIITKALLQITHKERELRNLIDKVLKSERAIEIRRIPLSQMSTKESRELESITELGKLQERSQLMETIEVFHQRCTFDSCLTIAETIAILSTHFDCDLIPVILSTYKSYNYNLAEEVEVNIIRARLTEIGCEDVVPIFLKALQSETVLDLEGFDKAFSKIRGSEFLFNSLTEFVGSGVFNAILFILSFLHSSCKYYNYEIYQAHLEAQEHDRQTPPNSDRSTTTINNFPNVTEFKQTIMSNSSKYNFPNAQKVQIFEQVDSYIENNHPTDPEIKTAIADLTLLLTQLQTQHPQVKTESQALTVLDAEFTEIQQSTTHPLVALRQQLLNPERHLQAIKATLAEIAKHYLEESVWSKAVITYLDKMSETPNQGA